jgi:hypothetical protein
MFTHASLVVDPRTQTIHATGMVWPGLGWTSQDLYQRLLAPARTLRAPRSSSSLCLRSVQRAACSVCTVISKLRACPSRRVHVRTQRALHSAFAVELSWWQGLARFGGLYTFRNVHKIATQGDQECCQGPRSKSAFEQQSATKGRTSSRQRRWRCECGRSHARTTLVGPRPRAVQVARVEWPTAACCMHQVM